MVKNTSIDAIHQEMHESLSSFSKEELIDILTHLVRTYVIEGIGPLKPELTVVDFPRHLRDLGFAQLIEQLKLHVDIPELNHFTIVGNEVFVEIQGENYSITGQTQRPLTRRESGESSGEDPFATPTPVPEAPSQAAEPQSQPGQSTKDKAKSQKTEPEDGEISDRFKMLELD